MKVYRCQFVTIKTVQIGEGKTDQATMNWKRVQFTGHYTFMSMPQAQQRSLKQEEELEADLIAAAHSAPHYKESKENSCGCAGAYTAHAAIELYAEAFEAAAALDKLEGFASFYGADFYELPRNTNMITLEKKSWQCPNSLSMANSELIPLRAGETILWRIAQ